MKPRLPVPTHRGLVLAAWLVGLAAVGIVAWMLWLLIGLQDRADEGEQARVALQEANTVQDSTIAAQQQALEAANRRLTNAGEQPVPVPEMPEPVPGPPGEVGERGPAGPPGASIVGPRGLRGLAGVDGKDGKSIVGPAGPPGVDGKDGAAGQPGPQGPAGPAGPVGPRGEQGPQGIPGVVAVETDPACETFPIRAVSLAYDPATQTITLRCS